MLAANTYAACLVDAFDDGNADGWLQCGEWGEDNTPKWEVSANAYCIGLEGGVRQPPPPPLNIDAQWSASKTDPFYSEGCLRTTFHAGTEADDTWSGHIAIAMRSNCKERGYQGLVGPSLGRISIFRSGIVLADDFGYVFEQGREYAVQMCAIGKELSLKYWAVGEPEPEAPQLRASDFTYKTGRLGVAVFMENRNLGRALRGCFDDVTFIPANACQGDVDCSGDVARADLQAVLAAWGDYDRCPPSPVADLNGDCTVGFDDLIAVFTAWGACP
jgi:hypothetical protein